MQTYCIYLTGSAVPEGGVLAPVIELLQHRYMVDKPGVSWSLIGRFVALCLRDWPVIGRTSAFSDSSRCRRDWLEVGVINYMTERYAL